MSIMTLLSDFGIEDHYVAAVKAAIVSLDPSISIIDISHSIEPSDIGHAGYILSSVFKDFPLKTVHLCAIDSNGRKPNALIAIELEGHYFVGYDCGLFSLLSPKQPSQIVVIDQGEHLRSTFKSKDILTHVAVGLAGGKGLTEFGESTSEMNILYARQLKATKREIVGHVIRVDHYGNLITNIVRSEFDAINKINGQKPFSIHFGRESATSINTNFYEVDPGDCVLFFNSNDRLQIGINKGNASELLGLPLDAQVAINFKI